LWPLYRSTGCDEFPFHPRLTTILERNLNLIATSACRDQLDIARRFAQEHSMPNLLRRFLSETSGATAIEYGLIAGLISVVIITALTTIGTNMRSKFNTIATKLS
jgi:pilus assembly protein Flp/PilA